MASYGAHHRTAEFRALFTRVLADVKEFIGTRTTCSCCPRRAPVSWRPRFESDFTRRPRARADRRQVRRALDFAGQGVWLRRGDSDRSVWRNIFADEVRRKLTPEIRCVYVQATESSTGARHDVEAIAKLVRASQDARPGTLLVVDAITGLGTARLDVDAWEST